MFGDYDADGVTATAVMVNFLQAAGANVSFHLPDRIKEGYGLQPMHIMQLAVPQHIGLVITVDCGTSSHEAIAAAKRFGIDVIVTDHHNIGDREPDAHGFVNPKMAGQPSDLAGLSGVGVAFYLAVALRMSLRERGRWNSQPEPNLKSYCDLVAIGTVADMVPLRGINRLLTWTGLEQINTGTRPGILALLAASGVRHKPYTADDIAFRLAPRINAAGRLAHPKMAFDALNAPNEETARAAAETLNTLNQRRRDIESEIFDEVTRRVDSRPEMASHNTLLMASEGWHEGVLGIVASRLVARYYRPAIVLSCRDGVAKGSGRSIPQVDLYAALNQCEELLDQYGGHRQAAGLTVKTEKIGRLKKEFEAAVAAATSEDTIVPELEIDGEIRFEQISGQLVNELETLAPFGIENPSPLFLARDVRVTKAAMVGKNHRRMTLCQPMQSSPSIEAIQFNLQPNTPRAESFDRLAFRLQWNRYRGTKAIQMVVEAF